MEPARMPKRLIEIDCKEVWRQVSNYIDDELDPDLRTIMASHFKNCAHCTAVLDGTRNVMNLAGDDKAFELPANMSTRLYDKLNTHLAALQPRKS
jgi:anti-sigma factor RsiW